jgi:hypothetical protein
MTTATTKKITRAALINAARKGTLFVKCSFRLTDDYAYDNAYRFGKEDGFSQAYLDESEFETTETGLERDRAYRQHREEIRTLAAGRHLFTLWDFRTKSGHVFGDKTGGSFNVHSNLSYSYEIRSK